MTVDWMLIGGHCAIEKQLKRILRLRMKTASVFQHSKPVFFLTAQMPLTLSRSEPTTVTNQTIMPLQTSKISTR